MSGQRAYYVELHWSVITSGKWYLGSHLIGSSRTSKRRNMYAKVRYSSQYAKLRDVLTSSHNPDKYSLALTLCRGNCAVLSRKRPANSPRRWILAEATGREGSRAAERTRLPKTTRKGRSGSQLSADGIRHGKTMTDGRETLTPPGMSTPDIIAPDGGTTRGRPAGVGTAMRSVSFMTAVYSILRTNLTRKQNHLPRMEASLVLRSSELRRAEATPCVLRPQASALPQDCAVDNKRPS
jgi:hypothetical protein